MNPKHVSCLKACSICRKLVDKIVHRIRTRLLGLEFDGGALPQWCLNMPWRRFGYRAPLLFPGSLSPKP